MAGRDAIAALQHRVSAVARTSHYGFCTAPYAGGSTRSGFAVQVIALRPGSPHRLQNGAAASVLYARMKKKVPRLSVGF